MNKLVLASLAVLIAGATASPAFADDAGRRAAGEPSAAGAGGKGPHREDAGEQREERRESRDDNRSDNRSDNREDTRRDWRGGREAGEAGDTRSQHRPDVRLNPPVASTPVRTGYGDWSRDRGGDRDGSRDRDHDRDDDRGWSRDRDRDDDRYGNHDRDHDGRGDWRNDRHDWRSDDRRDNRYYTRYRDVRWSGYNWYPQYRYRASSRYVYPYGYRPYRWTVGYRMPYAFYNPRSYWLDWRMYRLPPPPYGYQWVRVDRDVVLVSMATGYIRDVLYGVFW